MHVERPGRLSRRRLIGASLAGAWGAEGLAGCAGVPGRPPGAQALVPIDARVERIAEITVGLRPFRPSGPRVEAESLGDGLVVHNYGHGGSGWSLSWGSSARAVRLALQGSPRDVAVIGCGALGLTSAILAQRAGARVTLYAREPLPLTTSFRATGEWTPDSRIALAHVAAADFGDIWEGMARTAYAAHQAYIGRPGVPVEMVDQFAIAGGGAAPPAANGGPALDFASYGRRIADLTPPWQELPPGATPFAASAVSRSRIMIFNLADYARVLMAEFAAAGGQFRRTEFHVPGEVAALGHKVVINCTGYGARALWRDDTLVAVRGQLAHLRPQPEVHYGVVWSHVLAVPRRDGIVVQSFAGGVGQGYGSTDDTVDRSESEEAVRTLADLFAPPLWRAV